MTRLFVRFFNTDDATKAYGPYTILHLAGDRLYTDNDDELAFCMDGSWRILVGANYNRYSDIDIWIADAKGRESNPQVPVGDGGS